MSLADEEGFPRQGVVDFVNNVVNPETGTITIRGVFANPDHLLQPGMFVRLRLPVGRPRKVLLVIDRALVAEDGKDYLLVVDAKNVVARRPVKRGIILEDGRRVIEEGVAADDWVIVGRAKGICVGDKVKPERVAMPKKVERPE
jgi:multidrug efflux system membrane fusion protein